MALNQKQLINKLGKLIKKVRIQMNSLMQLNLQNL